MWLIDFAGGNAKNQKKINHKERIERKKIKPKEFPM
jgi:hypothetical protein